MRRLGSLVAFVLLLCGPRAASAQLLPVTSAPDTTAMSAATADSLARLRDVGDLFRTILKRPLPTEGTSRQRKGLSMSLLPNGGYNPATGAFIGASVAIGGWIGEPETTTLSSGSLGLTFSSGGRISLQFKSDFYLPGNHAVLKGDWRYQQIGQPTFGLGPAVDDREEFPMEYVLYRIHQSYFRNISRGNAYIGLGFHYDQYDQIVDERADAGEATPFTDYSRGYPKSTTSVGASAEFLLDTRDNPINASRGQYWNASLRTYMKSLGSDVSHQMLWSDFRAYVHPFSAKRNTLAIWNYLWFTFGTPPYLDLPAIGWDTYGRSGRGYVQGHIRGPSMVYTEFEYRMRFSRDDMWGGVAFVNLTGSTASNSEPFGHLDAGFGAGLRVKFTKRTNTNLAVDVGRGQDGSNRFFFGLQEVF